MWLANNYIIIPFASIWSGSLVDDANICGNISTSSLALYKFLHRKEVQSLKQFSGSKESVGASSWCCMVLLCVAVNERHSKIGMADGRRFSDHHEDARGSITRTYVCWCKGRTGGEVLC